MNGKERTQMILRILERELTYTQRKDIQEYIKKDIEAIKKARGL